MTCKANQIVAVDGAPRMATEDSPQARLRAGIEALATGRPVLLEMPLPGEAGLLVMAAGAADPETVALFLELTSGLIHAALPADRATALGLAPMAGAASGLGAEHMGSVELTGGDGSAGSATNRALTLRALADPLTTKADLVTPGHVLPIGVPSEAELFGVHPAGLALELARMAGHAPVAVLADVLSRDKAAVADSEELTAIALPSGLVRVDALDVMAAHLAERRFAEPDVCVNLPTRAGDFVAQVFRDLHGGQEHLVLRQEVDGRGPCPVLVHRHCFAGDVMRSVACDCRERLDAGIAAITGARYGVVIHLGREETSRGIEVCPSAPVTGRAALAADLRQGATAAEITAALGIASAELIAPRPVDAGAFAARGLTMSSSMERLLGCTLP